MHFVISKENASWCVDRVIRDIEENEIVAFSDKADADHFVSQGRAEALSEEDVAAILAASADDEDTGAGVDGETSDPEFDPVPAPAPAAKRTRAKK
ncbi:MAG: hypothetical protein NW216_07550 [Hyphomicrobium sp.]|nr:hypothetical protein [Hyphomicrobium sp.]